MADPAHAFGWNASCRRRKQYCGTMLLSALFAGMFDERTIAWLNKRGYLSWDQRGQGEAIIAAVNGLIARQC
jgi:hypothetical protein